MPQKSLVMITNFKTWEPANLSRIFKTSELAV